MLTRSGIIGGAQAPLYTSVVATGCSWNDSSTASGSYQFNSWTSHYARDNISNPTVYLQNSKSGESFFGSSITYTMAIEYPIGGTIYQGIFPSSGTATGVAADGSLLACSIPVTIPKGALFRCRIWGSVTAGFPYINLAPNSVLSEAFEFSTTETDKTMSGTVSGGTVQFRPFSIEGPTRLPTVGLVGDSRMVGKGDTGDVSGNLGYSRIVGDNFAYVNAGVGGSTTAQFIAAHSLRNSLLSKCTHILVVYGVNDKATAVADATVLANLATIGGYYPNAVRMLGTVMGAASSTDAFATENNQTNTQSCSGISDLIRALPAPYTRVVEIADVESTARNSGIWYVNGLGSVSNPVGQRPTVDGVHEAQFLLKRLVANNPLPPSWIHRP